MIEAIQTSGRPTFRTSRYVPTGERNPAFDGAVFLRSWNRFVGCVYRDAITGQLALCWSTEGPHPVQRETLRQRLEAHPGNVAEVLARVIERDEEDDRRILAGMLKEAAA